MKNILILVGLLFFGVSASALPKVTANIVCTSDSAYDKYNGQEVKVESSSEGTIIDINSLGVNIKVSQLLVGSDGGAYNFTLDVFNGDEAFIVVEELPNSILELVKSVDGLVEGESTQEVANAEDALSGVLFFQGDDSASPIDLRLINCDASKVSLQK